MTRWQWKREPPGPMTVTPEVLYKDHNNRTPQLTFRTYQILPHTNSYFDRLYSCLDLLPPGAPGVPQGGKARLVP